MPGDEQPGTIERRVPPNVLAFVLFRSLFVQLGFNPRTMQGPGFAFALYPALKFLYTGDALVAALHRNSAAINTHGFFTSGVAGAVVRLEEQVAAGHSRAKDVVKYRDAMAPSLAAIGDAFFWTALRPTAALMAIITAPALGFWSVFVFFILYNAVAISVRVVFFRSGYREPIALVSEVARYKFPLATRTLRRTSWVLAGIAASGLALAATGTHGRGALPLFAGTAAASTALAVRAGSTAMLFAALALALIGAVIW